MCLVWRSYLEGRSLKLKGHFRSFCPKCYIFCVFFCYFSNFLLDQSKNKGGKDLLQDIYTSYDHFNGYLF